MEQLRLTLPELEQEEKQIRENLGGIVRNFVKTGWHLSRIDRSGAYKLKGYHSVTEYARETFGMTPDGVSRFIHVYEKYSVQGDTPELREEYRDFNFSQLTEMLQLPEEDHTMIRPETKREDIRALKKFNKQSEHNPDNLLNWQQDPDDIIREAVKDFFFSRKKRSERNLRTIWHWPISRRRYKKDGQIPVSREEKEIPERPGIPDALSGSGFYQELRRRAA